MYFLRRSWGRGSTNNLVPSLPLFHLHGDMGGVVLPVAVDHKLGQHLILQLQWFSFIWGGGGGTCNKMKVMQVVHLGCARERGREGVREGREKGRKREGGQKT